MGDIPSESIFTSIKQMGTFLKREVIDDKQNLILFLLLTISISIVDFISPFMTQRLIDDVIPHKDIGAILIYSLIIISSLIVAYGLNLGIFRFAISIREKVLLKVRKRLMAAVLAKDPQFFSTFKPADILTRYANDLQLIGDFFYEYILLTTIYLINTCVFMLWLFYLNPLLSVCVCVLFLFDLVVAAVMYLPIVRHARNAQNLNSEQNEVILDILQGADQIRVYQQESAFFDRFTQKSNEYTTAQIRALWIREGTWATMDRYSRFINVAPIIIGALLISWQISDITIGLLVAFIQVLFYCSRYASYIAYSSLRGTSIIASIDRINEILKVYPKLEIYPVRVEETPDSLSIELQDLSFSYPSGKKIFERINLTIRSGEKVAIMAPSGHGKTTLAQLILGLIKPQSGRILFGGRDISSFPHHFYLTFFSYVSHDSHLFRMSVRENIEMGWHIPDDKAFHKLLQNLQIQEFIESLPNKEQTILNTDGITLSKGQSQRIALARALIREPSVLIVDEFTSGLDQATEDQILTDLLSLMQDKTMICITHSKTVAARMDRIIHLHNLPDKE